MNYNSAGRVVPVVQSNRVNISKLTFPLTLKLPNNISTRVNIALWNLAPPSLENDNIYNIYNNNTYDIYITYLIYLFYVTYIIVINTIYNIYIY